MTELIESARMFTTAVVEKYDEDAVGWVRRKTGLLEPSGADFEACKVLPYEVTEGPQPGNLLTTVGLNRITSRLINADQVWDNTHVGLAVGNSSTAEVIGDADLAGASKFYNAMDATYPQQSNGVLTFKGTYGTSDANFAWNEYAVVVPNTSTAFTDNATTLQASYVILNRKTATLGTKASGASWVFTVTITIT